MFQPFIFVIAIVGQYSVQLYAIKLKIIFNLCLFGNTMYRTKYSDTTPLQAINNSRKNIYFYKQFIYFKNDITQNKRQVLMRVNRNNLFGYFLFDLVYTTSDYYTRHPIYSRSRPNRTHITTIQCIHRYILKCINLFLEYNTYSLH